MLIPPSLHEHITFFLKEDIGYTDLTTEYLIEDSKRSEAVIVAKENCTVAGVVFLEPLFKILDPEVKVVNCTLDGTKIKAGTEIVRIYGKTKALLTAERTALNLLQRLSGIATLTRQMADLIKDTKAILVDTRKTTPGMRFFEKYATRIGGAKNHRMGLYDAVLIKDNHIKAIGSIEEAIEKIRRSIPFTAKIEVEVSNLKELEEALKAKADIVLLDNMDISTIKEAVRIAENKAVLEASGGVSPENIREIAETGVDYISSGFITHHATWTDMSMKLR